MLKQIYLVLLVLVPALILAEEPEKASEDAVEAVQDEADNGDGIKNPRSMSGMSILGNEETPKSLVIIPWKSSEMGDALTFSDTLKDRARPVDKDVFLRELRFYEIRTGE
jgi:hypothetical protein